MLYYYKQGKTFKIFPRECGDSGTQSSSFLKTVFYGNVSVEKDEQQNTVP